MPIQAVEPRRLYRQVADQLRGLMDRGEFPVGSRLPTERDLAAKLGISRPTVREALIALEVDGRVRIRVGSGIYVEPKPTAKNEPAPPMAGPFEVLGARRLIEGAIAEEAARLASAVDITALDDALDAMRDAQSDVAHMVELDRNFHVAIARITGNDALVRIVHDLFDQRMHPYFQQLAQYFENPETWRAAIAEHEAVRNAIARGDQAGAKAEMQRHLAKSSARFTENFRASAPMPISQTKPAAKRPKLAAPSLVALPSRNDQNLEEHP